MNLFTLHPHRQGVTYGEHGRFATGIAWRLMKSVIAFGVHAVFPCVSIRRELDLESTAAFLGERNRWIESAGANVGGNRDRGRPPGRRNTASGILDSNPPPDPPVDSGDGSPAFTGG